MAFGPAINRGRAGAQTRGYTIEVFGMAGEKETVTGQASRQVLHYLSLGSSVKVDQDVAAENHIERSRGKGPLAQIEPLEVHHLPDFSPHLHISFLAARAFQHELVEQGHGYVSGFADG